VKLVNMLLKGTLIFILDDFYEEIYSFISIILEMVGFNGGNNLVIFMDGSNGEEDS